MNNISMRLRAIAGQISGLEDLYEAANVIEGLYAATDWVENGIPAECFGDDETTQVVFKGKDLKAFAKARRKARGE